MPEPGRVLTRQEVAAIARLEAQADRALAEAHSASQVWDVRDAYLAVTVAYVGSALVAELRALRAALSAGEETP